MKVSQFPNPLVVIFLSILGGAFGVSVMLFQARSTPESRQFVESSGFYVWIFLLGLSMAVACISVPLVLQSLRQLKSHFAGNEVEIITSCVLMCLLALIPSGIYELPERLYVLKYHNLKMAALILLGWSVSILAMIGIWLIHVALRTNFDEIQPDHKQIAAFLSLREHLQRFLGVLGALVSLLTLSTGALRNALILSEVGTKDDIPAELILVYGGYFTVLIGLSYIPTHLLLTDVGRRICDAFFPISSLEPESLGQWHSGRKSLEAILNVQIGVGQSFQTNMTIFAPLVSGIISVLLSN